ncbi:hypothetical protein LZ023_06545 [Pseudomonas silvicola]|nr:hypothetical protein LZ023_06545 [Pseudomonas silvicola]
MNIDVTTDALVNPLDISVDGTILPYVPACDSFDIDAGAPAPIEDAPLVGEEPITPEEPGCESGDDDGGGIEIMAGYCPNGSWSGGICKAYNNVREDWMWRYNGVRYLRIQDCILPGTHNSAFDKEAPSTPSSETCQDVSPLKQLRAGIRVLDLRVQFFSGYSAGDPRRFSIFHSTTSGRTVANDILGALNQFRATPGYNTSREIVILDFHEFKNFTDAAHVELANLIKSRLGQDRIVPTSMAAKTIGEIWSSSSANTVIAYNDRRRDALFWAGVNQRWIGKNTPTNNQLRDFIKKVGDEKKGAWELRSVQAAKYSLPMFVPNDRSGDLMSWFSTSGGKPILSHYIINTDWSLRQRLVDNCIHGNSLRARSISYV